MRERGGGFIHRLRQFDRCQIPDEFAGLDNVLHAVFPAITGETNDRRVIIEEIKKTVGGKIQSPFAVLA
ncbi:hypothetical protein D3C72_1784820 [compost metagenome]